MALTLTEIYEAYKVRKLALDQAEKEEAKYKKLLKDAMGAAGEKDHTDQDGYRFERIVQKRKSMDEKMILGALKERGLTSCIKTVEAVDEPKVMEAVEAGDFPVDELQKAYSEKEIVMLKMTAPGKEKKK